MCAKIGSSVATIKNESRWRGGKKWFKCKEKDVTKVRARAIAKRQGVCSVYSSEWLSKVGMHQKCTK